MKIKLDSKGMAEILRSAEVRGLVEEVADEVAGNMPPLTSSSGEPIEVEVYARHDAVLRRDKFGPRASAQVSIAHAAGRAIESKYGLLLTAAASAGLKPKART